MTLYYLDTSIWLDFFEDRNEPNFLKSENVHKLINKLIYENNKILYSDFILSELQILGYSLFELKKLFFVLRKVSLFVRSTESQKSRSKDLSFKREIPKGDVLHALIARDNKAILISRDKHFKKLIDIIITKTPEELI